MDVVEIILFLTLRSFRESNGGEGPEFEDEEEDDRERVETCSNRSFQKSMKSFSDNFDDMTTFPEAVPKIRLMGC
jgi:hypothetical protein